MGAFYTNITLKGPAQAEIVELLEREGMDAFVSPTSNGCTVVFDERSETRSEALSELAMRLSDVFSCPALAVLVHDSDILMTFLFEAGKLTDEYNSAPDYFDDDGDGSPPSGGNASRLSAAFGRAERENEVRAILQSHVPYDEVEDAIGNPYLFAENRHHALVEALGLPVWSVSMGYRYLATGEMPWDLAPGVMMRAGSSSAPG